MKRLLVFLLLLAVAVPASSDVIQVGLNRSLANSLYCQLTGCTMTGTLGLQGYQDIYAGTSTATRFRWESDEWSLYLDGTVHEPLAATIALAGVGAGVVDNGNHKVYVSFKNTAGETTATTASNELAVVDKTVNGQIAVTGIPVCGAGDNTVCTARRIYMTRATTADTTTPFFVAEIADNTTTTATINTADAALLVAAPTTNTAIATYYNFSNYGALGINVAPTYTLDIVNRGTSRGINLATTTPTGAVIGIASQATGAATTNTGIWAAVSGATTNYGIYPEVAAGPNNWAVYAGSTAKSLFGGPVFVTPDTPTAGTMTATAAGQLGVAVHRYDWTNAMVTALGAVNAGDITVCTLPAKTVVENAYIVIDTPDSSANALTVALGITAATYLDYVIASDAKAAANTVYGDAKAELGAKLYDATTTLQNLPSVTGTTVVKAHFIKTTSTLSTVLGSTGHVYLVTATLP